MGIDFTALETILLSLQNVKNKSNLLTLSRQQIHVGNRTLMNNFVVRHMDYCENLFKSFGFVSIDSIDNSSYENATIVHNLNLPYQGEKKYDYIYDGGTTEHIFNVPQVFENIINLLEINGIFCSVTVNNNFSGHGFYQFSPELYLSMFTADYGMEIQCMYLAKVGTGVNDWIQIGQHSKDISRITTKFKDNTEVYIIVIAKKISDKRLSLLTNPPNQFSYEKIDWNKEKKLADLIDNSRTDKNTTHSYLDLYDSLFSSKRETSTNVLEVGICYGGSIKLWSDYFVNATVYGLDVMNIQDVWEEIKNKDKIVLHTSTDAYDETFFNKTFLNKQQFDMMLDDGPHSLESMKQFIKLYSQLLTVDGILVIEDVQSWDWIEILKNEVPEHLKDYIETYDLRLNKNRYDDIVFVINKKRNRNLQVDVNIPTELCEIMGRNKSDKGNINIMESHHNYTTLYFDLFKNLRQKPLKVFELGIGTNDENLPSNMGINGRPGASLYGWSEFFPNSEVYGADIDRKILFNIDRIKTYFCDQTDVNSVLELWNNKELIEIDFDIIIEDGLHTFSANVCFFENSIHKLAINGYYIIEDVLINEFHLFHTKIEEWKITYPNLSFNLIELPSLKNKIDNNMIVIKRM